MWRITALVVRQDVVSACDINDAIDAISQGRRHFSAGVLNNMQTGSLLSRISGYRYGYAYGYGYGRESRGGRSEEGSR
ncbi:MAG: hypothetical protein ACLU9S_24740 [Oscillospiraceae bacterium]